MTSAAVCAERPAAGSPRSTELFDEHGRRIPSPRLQSACHPRTRRWFIPVQPAIDYAAIHARIAARLGGADELSAAEFATRAQAILQGLRDKPALRNLANAVRVPFFLPRASHPDIGDALDQRYLPAVATSFAHALPGHEFVNHHKSGLKSRLTVADGSRHQRLIDAMAAGPVVGWYFASLLEYSVPAAREQMADLPDELLLAGGYDTCAAFIGAPDLLLRQDGYPPLLWLAGLDGEQEGVGYHFEAYGYDLTFNRRPHLGQAAEYWASGLTVIG